MKRTITCSVLMCLMAAMSSVGCGRKDESRSRKGGNSVRFRIKELSSAKDGAVETVQWLAMRDKYKFRMELALKNPVGDEPFVPTNGSFFREQNGEQESMFFTMLVSAALGASSLSAP